MRGRWFPILCQCVLVGTIAACGAGPGKATAPRTGASAETAGQSPGAENAVAAGEEKQGQGPLQLSPDGKQYFDAGVLAGANGRLAQAEQAFLKVTDTDPDAPQPYYNLGVVYERRGADLKALNHYRQSIRKKGDYLPALSAAARLLLRYGKKEEAIQLVRAAGDRNGADVEILVLYADVLTMCEKYDEAIRVAKKALRIDERHAGAMLQIGKANLKMGRLELAESIFNQVMTINDHIAEVYFLSGLLELKKGFRILAIKKFEKAIELNPFYPEALNNLALEYMLAGNYGDAVELLERAIQITPSWGLLYLNYGNALRGAGKWKRALAALTRAGKMLSDSPAVTFNLAVLYYAADELGGLNRVSRLKKSRELFSRYTAQKGATLSPDDDAIKYIKELDLLIDREQVRVQRQKEADEREKQRSTHKSTTAKPSENGNTGTGSPETDDWKNADDDGWE